ncbi:hypothetical protein ACK3TF_003099 [Chlorella vulgaris]
MTLGLLRHDPLARRWRRLLIWQTLGPVSATPVQHYAKAQSLSSQATIWTHNLDVMCPPPTQLQAAINSLVWTASLLMVVAYGWALTMLFRPVSMPLWILLWGPVGASSFVALFTITVYRRAAFRRGLLALLPVPCLTLNAVVQAGILIAKHAFCVWQGILLVTPLGFAVLAYMVAVTAQWMPSVGCAVNHLAKASPSFAVATWAVVMVTSLYTQEGASPEQAAWVAAAAFLSFAAPALHFMEAVPVVRLLSAYRPIVPKALHFTLQHADFMADPAPQSAEQKDACICFVKKGEPGYRTVNYQS